ncbi:MAG: hypothetical protein SD837_00075 [Candidatus Electrothrix scaldis]|nr:MAG: hypothetical protein SD837_00075 [Candidatus Electrothrix sp. GW3-3]
MRKEQVDRLIIVGVVLVILTNIPKKLFADETQRVIHVFVALCDNVHQGIVPVPPALGNGDDPGNNLYWGALYGVKTFLKKSPRWQLVSTVVKPPHLQQKDAAVLERCIFRHKEQPNVYLVADAYQGRKIKQAIVDFLDAASGALRDKIIVGKGEPSREIDVYGGAQLLAYVGHDGLMDFSLSRYPRQQNRLHRDAIILACLSQKYFAVPLAHSGANPLLWTTGFMAPEAYTLESALEGWIARETPEQIRQRAAVSYHKYQKCGINAAKRLLVSGF